MDKIQFAKQTSKSKQGKRRKRHSRKRFGKRFNNTYDWFHRRQRRFKQLEALDKRTQLVVKKDIDNNHTNIIGSKFGTSKFSFIDGFVVAVGIILLGTSFHKIWVNWGQMITTFAQHTWNSLWNVNYGNHFAMLRTLAMAPTPWSFLLLVSVCGRQLLDKRSPDNEVLTPDNNALTLSELAQTNDELRTRL